MTSDANRPETAHKARWAGAGGAFACLFLAYAGPYVGLPIPPIEDTLDAAVRALSAAPGYAAAFTTTWFGPRNVPK